MLTRELYEQRENDFLAPYAMKSAQSEGREYPETQHPFRTDFQRDRDRIIHSNAFRRLEYKTQVFVYHEGDHYRTRLTHSLEGSQIARTIARALRLNEDLSEAIILAHDLGHTPFGHSGEEVMNRLMKNFGGFEHNRQSLRIVTLLEERYPDFPGLNLTYEVREGLAKHQTSYDQPNAQASIKKRGNPTLEAQVVNLADEIAYSNHDLDDGLRSSLLNLSQLREIQLWRENYKKEGNEKIKIRQTVKSIINAYVSDLVNTVEQNVAKADIRNLEDIRATKISLVTYSEPFDKKNKELKSFLREFMYKHPHVKGMADRSKKIIEGLFTTYLNATEKLPQEVKELMKREKPERVVCDYIAGMTDRFAIEEYGRLFEAVKPV